MSLLVVVLCFCFLFNVTATTEIYTYGHTLALHDALPISVFRVWLDTHFPDRAGKVMHIIQSIRVVVTPACAGKARGRSEEHTSELQSLMRISYAVFCL